MSIRDTTLVGRAVEETTYHFTHYRTRETFLKLALGSLAGFGLLAFLFAYVAPFNYVFGGLAIGGFVVFVVLEVGGSIIGYLYEHGVIKAVRETAFFGAVLVALGVSGAYTILGGVLVAALVGAVVMPVIPQVLTPVALIAYIAFSVTWAAHGMMFWNEDGEIPPLTILRYARRFGRRLVRKIAE